MDWPEVSVECLSGRRFRPPFCPWPDCPDHAAGRFHGHGHGCFRRACDGRRVPRFRCLTCRRTCSLQTFAFSYYLKRPALSAPVAAGLQAGSAHRQVARSLACAPSTVTGLAARLGRHAVLLLARALSHLPGLREPVVFDHFETFALAQEYALGVGTAVGSRSWFVYALDPAPHPRAGKRSPAQLRSLHRLKRPPAAGGYLGSTRRVLDILGQQAGDVPLELVTDDHHAYRLAVQKVRASIRHRAFRNPPRGPKGSPRSPEAVIRDRAMFPNDLLHALLRHTCAHHRRETIAFARRHNALMERLFLTAAWRNFVKQRSERRPDGTTPAMRLGLARRAWTWADVLARRLQPSRERVPHPWMGIYRREWLTPALPANRRHALRNAF